LFTVGRSGRVDVHSLEDDVVVRKFRLRECVFRQTPNVTLLGTAARREMGQ
jgi:hypothetical protein